jgi:hypothetical protein
MKSTGMRQRPGTLCAVVILATSVLAGAGCRETLEKRYSSLAEAERDGAIARGWIPSWVSSSATEIAEVHNLDTNNQLLMFTFGEYRTEGFVDACSAVDGGGVSLPGRVPVRWWPQNLRSSSRTVPTNLKYFLCKDGRFFGIDEVLKRAFMWSGPG